MELEDLTPCFGSEHWETWLLLHRMHRIKPIPDFGQSWPKWVEKWKPTLNKYWEYQSHRE